MMRQTLGVAAVASLLFLPLKASAQGVPVLGPGDAAIGIDADGKVAVGRYPTAESPAKAIDGVSGSKYLNFAGKGAGFIVTPAAATPVESFQIRTGNDAPGRDPGSWELYGFNGALTTVDSGPDPAINASGLAEAWTLIGAGSVALPDGRGVLGPVVDVNPAGVGYQHYKILFPTLKNIADPLMQIDEIQFYADDAASPGQGILAPSNPIVAVHHGFQSRYPGAESPDRAIDYSVDPVTLKPNTKYLNFGKENAGLIFTNAQGPVQLANMSLTTANDWADRDPASYMLWGTNDAIQSTTNSDGNGGENWTLISSGPLSLPGDVTLDDFRGETVVVPINATAAYSSYKIVFPTLKSGGTTNSMQIADIQFFAVPEPATAGLALVAIVTGFSFRRKK